MPVDPANESVKRTNQVIVLCLECIKPVFNPDKALIDLPCKVGNNLR
jgi:hypothetical protein